MYRISFTDSGRIVRMMFTAKNLADAYIILGIIKERLKTPGLVLEVI